MVKKVELHVLLDGGEYRPGEEIEGRVILSLKQALHGAVLTAVLQCLEVIKYSNADAMKHTSYHSLYWDEIALTRVNTSFSTGEYEFPIKWKLPETLPPHFDITYNCGRSYIVKRVVAKLNSANKSQPVALANQCFQFLQETVPTAPLSVGEPALASTSRELKSFGLIRAGSCALEVALDRDHLLPSKPANLRINIRNQSKYSIKEIKIRLLRQVHMHTPNVVANTTRPVLEWKTVLDQVSADQLPGGWVSGSLLLDSSSFQHKGVSRESHFIRESYQLETNCVLVNKANIKVNIPVKLIHDASDGKSQS